MDPSNRLTTIRAEPFNAEAQLTALDAPITPTSLHFVRRNFALPSTMASLRSAVRSRIHLG